MADPQTTVKDADGRELVIQSIGVGDLFDLLEAAGDTARNPAWMQLAMTVASVRTIDGVPVLMPTSKPQVKALGMKLGNAGLAAVRGVLFPETPEAAPAENAEADAAKN